MPDVNCFIVFIILVIYTVYSSQNVIPVIKSLRMRKLWCTLNIAEKVHTDRTLMERSEEGQTLVRYRWDDNIQANRKVLVLEGVDCSQYCSG
jgi:hypothetical protein